jgi:hypothetical protein
MRLPVVVMSVALSGLLLAGAAHAAAPDLTGVWSIVTPTGPDGGPAKMAPPPFTPAARAAAAEEAKLRAKYNRVTSEARTKCLPLGMPGMMASPFGIEFLQTKNRIGIYNEVAILPRTIYLNKKSHPDSTLPGWNGHSIGHWEGGTLVVDTIGFNGRVRNVSEKMHMTERFHLEPNGDLINEMTLDDPETYTQPYHVTHRYRLAPGEEAQEVMEYVCEVDPANLFAYEAEQKAEGRPSAFSPSWAIAGYKDPASVAAAEAAATAPK